eukprot:10018992-Lingulodinium_polyedra.AAC.1
MVEAGDPSLRRQSPSPAAGFPLYAAVDKDGYALGEMRMPYLHARTDASTSPHLSASHPFSWNLDSGALAR